MEGRKAWPSECEGRVSLHAEEWLWWRTDCWRQERIGGQMHIIALSPFGAHTDTHSLHIHGTRLRGRPRQQQHRRRRSALIESN